MSNEQIAKNIGINASTLYNWKKEHLEIDKALKKGKENPELKVKVVGCGEIINNVAIGEYIYILDEFYCKSKSSISVSDYNELLFELYYLTYGNLQTENPNNKDKWDYARDKIESLDWQKCILVYTSI